MKKLFLILMPIILLISCGGKSSTSSSIKSTDFTLEQMGGGKITLSEQKGKVVLVDFWATWCGPCKIAIPYIINIYNTYKDQGLIVLGVSLDQERSDLDKFVKDQPIPYPILYGNPDVARAYDVQGIPTMVIFDKKGKVAYREVGFSTENIDSLKSKVSQLLQQ
jgi:thiol-disulfide isomerase/thioredoxin